MLFILGIRPEKVSRFDEECWTLMEQCWSGEPSKRPLLGAIQPVLESIQQKAERGKSFQQNDALKLEDTEPSSEQTNPALALAEPNNQRGAPTSPLFPRVYRGSGTVRPFCHKPRHLAYPNTFVPLSLF